MKTTFVLGMTLLAAASSASFVAAQEKAASPAGTSATQIGEKGPWIEITAGRPIKRGRDLWGTGANYGKTLNPSAPVWRAGADVSTRLKTEAPLQIGGKSVPAGEYSLFIDPKSPTDWTLVVSSWGAKKSGQDPAKDALWGAYNYTPAKDVARVPMAVGAMPLAVDQLTWNFADVTSSGGKLVLIWDKVIATAPFSVQK